jgi:hypothetical protein
MGGRTNATLVGLEAMMGNKDRGSKNSKKAATKSLKEKRRDKKAKKNAHDASSMDRTFGH